MCTVTYLPISNSSFILTHNRDEHISRSIALLPSLQTKNNLQIAYPKDEQGGGTWIATSENFTLCLLNGGFLKHLSSPPYKHSRGLVILDFFEYCHVETFINKYDFAGLEPFTLILIDHSKSKLYQIVNNIQGIHYSELDSKMPAIWSSTTLYADFDRAKRKEWFNEWLKKNTTFKQEAIIEFHQYKNDEADKEGIMIDRNSILKTVSLTSVLKTELNQISIFYEDFIQHKNIKLVIKE